MATGAVSKTDESFGTGVRLLYFPPPTGVSFNGRTAASKTANAGSIPAASAKIYEDVFKM